MSSLFEYMSLKPRIETAHRFALTQATCTPGASRRISGRLANPDSRMACREMTYTAAATFSTRWLLREAEVTRTSINCSRVRSGAGVCATATPGPERTASAAASITRRTITGTVMRPSPSGGGRPR